MSRQFKSVQAITRRADPIGYVHMSVSESRHHLRHALSLGAALKLRHESFQAELIIGHIRRRCAIALFGRARTGMDIIVWLEGFGDMPAPVIRGLPSALAVAFDLPPLHYAEFAGRSGGMMIAHA